MKDVTIVTPVGMAFFPRLNTPDTKFDKDGVYNVQLGLSKEDALPIQRKLLEIAKEFADGEALDEAQLTMNEDEETGLLILKAKTKASFRAEDGRIEKRALTIFNKHEEPVEEFVRHGAKIALRLKLVPYKGRGGVGISRLITHVMMLENGEQREAAGSLFGDLVEKKEKMFEANPDM